MVKIDHFRPTHTFDQSSRPVLAHISEGSIRKALVRFRGNVQRPIYEVIKYDAGRTPLACFRSMDDAIEFAQC